MRVDRLSDADKERYEELLNKLKLAIAAGVSVDPIAAEIFELGYDICDENIDPRDYEDF